MTRIKTGDTVFHRPTGETWVVAFADYTRGELAWCGWPEGLARISDCELVESCSEQESLALIQRLAELVSPDIRKLWALIELERIGKSEQGRA